eukprot:UC4_evm1s842
MRMASTKHENPVLSTFETRSQARNGKNMLAMKLDSIVAGHREEYRKAREQFNSELEKVKARCQAIENNNPVVAKQIDHIRATLATEAFPLKDRHVAELMA